MEVIHLIKKKLTDSEAEEIAQYFFTNDYKDRGILKWQGFFLSDHKNSLKKSELNIKNQF